MLSLFLILVITIIFYKVLVRKPAFSCKYIEDEYICVSVFSDILIELLV
ncbi:hypothetical protein HMPREF1143_0629 [Peptoanaerobacter stomatis]|uniref:Uncharacterized protein n=1 Tax=Peptoanaerobacter stomatis TaxID=796937 RepID=J4WGB1_9FIRM|nr:hypothetical protein HMPREF1143_0629 [Peptoanaerobacter stomatis]